MNFGHLKVKQYILFQVGHIFVQKAYCTSLVKTAVCLYTGSNWFLYDCNHSTWAVTNPCIMCIPLHAFVFHIFTVCLTDEIHSSNTEESKYYISSNPYKLHEKYIYSVEMLLKFKIKGEVLLLCYLSVVVIGHKHETCSVLCRNRASLLHSSLQVTLPNVCVCVYESNSQG